MLTSLKQPNSESVQPESASVADTPTEQHLNKKNQRGSGVMKPEEVRVGLTIRLHQKIKEGDKERIQVFEGIVIAQKGGKGMNGTMTVRKISDGVGVEKIYPLHLPSIDKIELVKTARVRRSKLYFLRSYTKKLKEKQMVA